MTTEKRCIDCNATITPKALALNESGLWCVRCEKARRKRIDKQMAAITKRFERAAQGEQHD